MAHKRYAATDGQVDDPIALIEEIGMQKGSHEWRRAVGAWRWPGMWDSRQILRELAEGPYTVDLGGMAGPVGYNTLLVDYDHPDRKALWDIPGTPDGVFCLHTLEHVEDALLFLMCIAAKIRAGGFLVVMVPSYRNENLHHRRWPYHRQTFHVEGDEDAPGDSVALEALLRRAGFTIHDAKYQANENILAIAVTQKDTEAD